MEKESISEQDYVEIKELMVNREKQLEYFLNKFQNSIINFCKNYNMFQKKDNFFNLTLREQFDFNECVEFSANKLKNDFKDMENFYVKCKSKCVSENPYSSKEIDKQIESYNNAGFEFMRGSLPPCINECKNLYTYLNFKYYKYMIEDLGIYTELINYKSL